MHLGTDEGRFSSRYRLSPQTHPDMLSHPELPISAPSPMGTFRKIPMPFPAFTGAVTYSSKKIGEPFFQPLSGRVTNPATDVLSALSSSKELPSTHYFRDAQPYFRTRNSIRNSFRNLAPSYRAISRLSKQLPCQAGIEDQRNKAQKTPCGATLTNQQEQPMISTPLEEPGTASLIQRKASQTDMPGKHSI